MDINFFAIKVVIVQIMVNVFKISLIIFKCASVIKVIFINNQVMMDIFVNGQQISYSKLNYL